MSWNELETQNLAQLLELVCKCFSLNLPHGCAIINEIKLDHGNIWNTVSPIYLEFDTWDQLKGL